MQIVTLTSDNGLQDYYVAAIKGAILNQLPEASIIDISHNIRPFDVANAAFQLRCCYQDFPKGTIHIIGVDSEPVLNGDKVSFPTIMLFKGQYFISNDNGFFGCFLDEERPDELYQFSEIVNNPEMVKFPTKNCFIPLAKRIAAGEVIGSFTTPTNAYKRAFIQKAVIDHLIIRGNVIHVDSYGNLITNISKADFNRFGEKTPFTIKYLNKEYYIDEINETYNNVTMGERVALFNSSELLEIAINRGANGSTGGANKLFGMRQGDPVHVEFTPKGSKEDIQSLFD
jgi:S-adenosylmethionine hydrolase